RLSRRRPRGSVRQFRVGVKYPLTPTFLRGIPMRVIGAFALVLTLIGTVAAQDANKKEMSLLEGEWSMVSGQADGQPMPKQFVDTGKRVAKDGEVTITISGQTFFKAKFT